MTSESTSLEPELVAEPTPSAPTEWIGVVIDGLAVFTATLPFVMVPTAFMTWFLFPQPVGMPLSPGGIAAIQLIAALALWFPCRWLTARLLARTPWLLSLTGWFAVFMGAVSLIASPVFNGMFLCYLLIGALLIVAGYLQKRGRL